MLECTSPSGKRQAAKATLTTHILNMKTDVPCSDIFLMGGGGKKQKKQLIICSMWKGKYTGPVLCIHKLIPSTLGQFRSHHGRQKQSKLSRSISWWWFTDAVTAPPGLFSNHWLGSQAKKNSCTNMGDYDMVTLYLCVKSTGFPRL